MYDLYRATIIDFICQTHFDINNPIPEKVIQKAIEVLKHRDAVRSGGHFAKAIVENDLLKAIHYCEDFLEYLPLLTTINHNCFIGKKVAA
jgi:hypothetical protein